MSAVRRGQASSNALLERLVLMTFDGQAGLTRLELGEMTGLSRNVVAGVVASLIARGDLTEARQGPAAGARGRPPARYHRTALLPPVLLVQLRRDGSTLVSSLGGNATCSEVRQCTPWPEAWGDWSRSVLQAAGHLGASAPLPPRLAVLSVPFPVAAARGKFRRYDMASAGLVPSGTRMPRHAPWLEEDPRPALSRLLRCTTLMVNDANLAALGEARSGAGRERRTVLHICVAGGIGAGFVIDGRLLTGAHGFSGELAHVQVTPDGAPCFCGNHGCLITESAVRRPWSLLAPLDGEELGGLVGRALAPLVTALDPDCVVVDARLAHGCKPFIAGVTAELARRCPPGLVESLEVVAGELEDAERHGALAAADAHASALLAEGAWSPAPHAD